jgi:O-antigen/teichoic acid export membrane protein
VILLLVIVLNNWVAAKLNNPRLASWLFFLPLGLVLASISKLCNSWLIRKKEFKASSINKASQKMAETSAQLAFGFFKTGNGLILGDLTGRLFNAIVSYYQGIRSGLAKKKISKTTIYSNLKRYSEFPKYGILPSMLNALGGMMPVFIISSYYSVEISGSFNFSRIILSVPFALIASGISQVLMQQVSERRHKNQPVHQEMFSLATTLSVLSVAGVVVLYLAGGPLFALVFGEKWRLSGEYTSILIFSYAVSFIVSPFSVVLVVLGKIRWASFWQTFYFFAVSILWLLNDISVKHFLIVLVMVDLISYTTYGLLIYKTIRNYENALEPRVP